MTLVDEEPESNRQGGRHDTAGVPSQGRRPEQRNDGQIGAAAVLSPTHHECKGHHCEHDAANDGRLKPREQQREDAGHTERAREVKGDRAIDRVGGKHSRQTASQPPVNRAEVGEIHRQGRGLVLQEDFSQPPKLVVAPGRVEKPPRSSQKQDPEQQSLGDVTAVGCASPVGPEGSWKRSTQLRSCQRGDEVGPGL
jgi:hypothetical protein